MDKKLFLNIAKENKTKGNITKKLILAFFGGGVIAIINQGMSDLIVNFTSFNESEASMLSSMILVLLVGILTYFGYYQKLGQMFGAGLFVPITGFSNAMIASAIDGREEGIVNGIGKSIFVMTGSTIAYGIGSAIIVSIIRAIVLMVI